MGGASDAGPSHTVTIPSGRQDLMSLGCGTPALFGELDFKVGDALIGEPDVLAGGGHLSGQGLAFGCELTDPLLQVPLSVMIRTMSSWDPLLRRSQTCPVSLAIYSRWARISA